MDNRTILIFLAILIVLTPVVVVIAVLMRPDGDRTKQCPECKRTIPVEATRCEHCGASVQAADTTDTKECPRCAETVRAAATVCRFCGFQFPRASEPTL